MTRKPPCCTYLDTRSLCEVECLPYVPVPLDQITAYTNLPDYMQNRIKNISTVGFLKSMNFSQVILCSTTKNERAKIKLDIRKLYSGVDFHGPGVDPKDFVRRVVRVFGCLATQDEEIVIRVDHFSKVNHVKHSEQILRLMASVARQKISAYQYDPCTTLEIQYQMELAKIEDEEQEMEQWEAEVIGRKRQRPAKRSRLPMLRFCALEASK